MVRRFRRMRRTPIKNPFAERQLFYRRSLLLMAFVLSIFTILVARLLYLQVQQHEHFTTLSNDNRVRLQAIPPIRGMIYDRNGVVLAENLPSYRLEVTPEQVDDQALLLAELGGLVSLSADELDRFERSSRKAHKFQGVPLKFNLTEKELARFAVNRQDFPGVEVKAHLARHYPEADNMVTAVGYVGRLDARDLKRVDKGDYSGTTHIGKVGVERSYEDVLHGTAGHRRVETNAEGRVLRTLSTTKPTPGNSLYLTMDVALQKRALEALGENNGSIVAIDPRNGDVLALVSKPAYNPNLFVNGIDRATYSALNTDKRRPLFNRALKGTYPPGSTLKPLMGLAGMELGMLNLEQKTYCGGYFQLPNNSRKYRDWKRWGHGHTNLDKAIVESCDVYFYQLAKDLGVDRMHAFMSRFGLGQRSGIDMIGESSGLLPSRGWKRRRHKQVWFPGETLIMGIGQGFFLTTPLQLAEVAATIARRGERVQPRMVRALELGRSGEVQQQTPKRMPPVELKSISYWQQVIRSMTRVVHSRRGTAKRIGEGITYTIAGKTGTAQVFSLKQYDDESRNQKYDQKKLVQELHDHALFIAFAPAETPEIALAVVVEHGGSGGSVAAPVARQVFDQYFGVVPEVEEKPLEQLAGEVH